MKSLKVIVVAVLVCVLGINIATARHHGEGGMRDFLTRDGLMHLIGAQRGILRDIAKEGSAEDAAEFIRAANALSAMLAMIPSTFEKNSMPDISRANSEIGSDWDNFVATANAQSIVAASIATTAMTQGLEAAKPMVDELDCGSCHTPYRAE